MLRFFSQQLPSAAECDAVLDALPHWPDREHATHFRDWYVGTMACYQMGGTRWRTWNEALLAAALPHQRTDGSFAGSFDPVDEDGKELGRVGGTALLLHAPLVQRRFATIRR